MKPCRYTTSLRWQGNLYYWQGSALPSNRITLLYGLRLFVGKEIIYFTGKAPPCLPIKETARQAVGFFVGKEIIYFTGKAPPCLPIKVNQCFPNEATNSLSPRNSPLHFLRVFANNIV
jgi:hypothetical protein